MMRHTIIIIIVPIQRYRSKHQFETDSGLSFQTNHIKRCFTVRKNRQRFQYRKISKVCEYVGSSLGLSVPLMIRGIFSVSVPTFIVSLFNNSHYYSLLLLLIVCVFCLKVIDDTLLLYRMEFIYCTVLKLFGKKTSGFVRYFILACLICLESQSFIHFSPSFFQQYYLR